MKPLLEKYAFSIQDYIMSHSLKNGDISKFNLEYNSIFDKII